MKLDDSYTFVNFNSGSGGEFIISLIILMHNNTRINKMQISEQGSCHKNRSLEPEVVSTWSPKYLDDFVYKTHKSYEFLPVSQQMAPVCKSHLQSIELLALMEHYSNSSVINIVPDDTDTVARNVIYKTLLPIRERTMFGGDDLVRMLTKLGLPITNDISSVTINEFDQVYNMIKHTWDHSGSSQLHSNALPSNYYTIKLSEIINNKKGLFTKLNNITGFPITNEALDFYDLYISKQPTPSNMKDFRSKLKQEN